MKKESKRITARVYMRAFVLCLSEKLIWLAFAFAAFVFVQIWRLYALILIAPALVLITVYRFYIANRMKEMIAGKKLAFGRFGFLLKTACIRLAASCAWSVPYALILYKLYQYVFVLPAPEWNRDFTKLGSLFASSAEMQIQTYIGTAIFFGLLLITLLLGVYGLNRGKVFDYLQSGDLSFFQMMKKVKGIRKNTGSKLTVLYITNVLLCLPALIAPVVVPAATLAPLLTGKIMNDLYMVYMYVKAGIVSVNMLATSFLLFLLLYLPLLPVRKLRIAKVVNEYE